MNNSRLSPKLINDLRSRTAEDAVQFLREQNLLDVETLSALAVIALESAEQEPKQAHHWLAICRAAEPSVQSSHLRGQVAYAQARLDMRTGDLDAAEANILQAQQAWQIVGQAGDIARSNVGLTQVLAMQGRYAEAESAIVQAVEHFDHVYGLALDQAAGDAFESALRLIRAKRNLANLYGYQEKHDAALTEFANITAVIGSLQQGLVEASEEYAMLQYERAHVAISQSVSYSHLDQISLAESTLNSALPTFAQEEDAFSRGQIFGNLGSLYLRTGQYADALSSFEQARAVFEQIERNGSTDAATEAMWDASLSLLEQATAYISLNLLPEAERALKECESRFRSTFVVNGSTESGLPQELGSTLYALGQVYVRLGDLPRAEQAVTDALQIFESIQNQYWLNRCRLALATISYHQTEFSTAARRLDELFVIIDSSPNQTDDLGVTVADVGLRVLALLLRLHVHIEMGETTQAETLLAQTRGFLDTVDGFSHLRLLLLHAQGRLMQAVGNLGEARTLFWAAIDLLEAERAMLPVEEIRSAFVIDKTDLYTDLILNLLSTIDAASSVEADSKQVTTDELVAETFAIVERARSRTLLERLLATLTEDDVTEDDLNRGVENQGSGQESFSTREDLRRELHWLYNRLLGQEGVRRVDAGLTHQIEKCERTLQKLEWQDAPVLQQVEPVDLKTLQHSLAVDQQALVYYIAKNEVMAFVVDQNAVLLVRDICTKHALASSLRDFRFQLGRFQLGEAYTQRHASRLQRGMLDCLRRLHTLLMEPLTEYITANRLQIIPFGQTHLVPFHALYNGQCYLIEDNECSYAPSASIAVTCHAYARTQQPFTSFAAFGITDDLIPAARAEVQQVRQYFEDATAYVDDNANHSNLHQAVRNADILHIATHGLYRSDNPFFSSLKLADGWIDVRGIYRLPLQARLVVLSACESGSLHIQDGDEVIGLARGFLGAGAHSLIVSMWTVHDATAAQLMNKFYYALQNAPSCSRPSAALRKAQLGAIADGLHPYYWAPFTFIG